MEYKQDTNMSDETGPHEIYGHVAVRLDQYIIAFGGEVNDELLSIRIIWMYNLYTEKWKKHTIPSSSEAPATFYNKNSAVAIGSDVYMFDGRQASEDPNDALWMLTTLEENIYWERVISNSTPSHRWRHSGWEHEGQMWIFGGKCKATKGYCNEFLCFDPSTKEWTTPKCSGSVPTPRGDHATTQVKDKVWLFGGRNWVFHNQYICDDLFELDMSSLTWTEIPTTQPRPRGRFLFSLNAITESKLLLHGGYIDAPFEEQLSDGKLSWILDLPSKSWKQCSSSEEASNWRESHTGTTGLNNCVIVWRIWHMTSFWDITDVFLHILVEYTLQMKNQLDATLGMLSIFCN